MALVQQGNPMDENDENTDEHYFLLTYQDTDEHRTGGHRSDHDADEADGDNHYGY